ncbi:MAG: AtpZ/AtpI family protein [Pseudomonadota bacterium]|nr:AtpZ/AtpI family protein [Pseudomonadota bacterium]
MAERKSQEPQKDIDDRIDRLRKGRDNKPDRSKSAHSGLGFGMRIGVELVAALIIGVVIGIVLDDWLDTKPWCMVAFFVFGAVAGMFNVFRVVRNHEGAIGYRPATEKNAEPLNKDRTGE